MSWQGEHKRRNTCSPAAASCAKPAPVEAARTMHATAQLSQVLIIVYSFNLQTEMFCQNRAGFAPRSNGVKRLRCQRMKRTICPASVPYSEVRKRLRHPLMRTSESKGH